jgi:hypothetical protein
VHSCLHANSARRTRQLYEPAKFVLLCANIVNGIVTTTAERMMMLRHTGYGYRAPANNVVTSRVRFVMSRICGPLMANVSVLAT